MKPSITIFLLPSWPPGPPASRLPGSLHSAFLWILVLGHWCFSPTALCQSNTNNPHDTIWVGNPTRTTTIAFDINLISPPALHIGSNAYFGRVLGCCDVILKALTTKPAPTSLYIRYGEKYFSGTIAFKENLSIDEEVLDFRKHLGLPEPINENRAITSESPSLEMQQITHHMSILASKTKDRINTIATLKDRMTFKLSDIMQDENFLYFKFLLINKSDVPYKIDLIDFLYRHTRSAKDYRQAQPMSDNEVRIVPEESSKVLIYVLPKFVLTSKWILQVTVHELNGTRKIILEIPNEKVTNAERL